MTMLQTEYEFTLPKGYVDQEGTAHRNGVMRLATAIDEITPLRDARVKGNDAYLSIMILSRVITKLGAMPSINTGVIERMFTADLAYLQEFYRRINEGGGSLGEVACPSCSSTFEVEPGEAIAAVGAKPSTLKSACTRSWRSWPTTSTGRMRTCSTWSIATASGGRRRCPASTSVSTRRDRSSSMEAHGVTDG